MKLADLIQQRSFGAPEQEAMLNVIVTGSWLIGELNAAMAPYGVTPAQYNVLRILRGTHPGTLTCSAIGARLLDRTPDVTRLLNRLERVGFVHRKRATHDRRIVEVGITDEGLQLLDQMQDDVVARQADLTRHLSVDDCRALSALLERMRTDQAE
jgi:DNA-binding MarR family transcriptional regulator